MLDLKLPFAYSLAGVVVAIAVSCSLSLWGFDPLHPWRAGLTPTLSDFGYLQATGFAAVGGLVLLGLHSVRKRQAVSFGMSYPVARLVHEFLGIGTAALVVVHAGFRWGMNLNGWITGTLLAAALVAVSGLVIEARLLARAVAAGTDPARAGRRPVTRAGGRRRGDEQPARARMMAMGRWRLAWLQAHVALVTVLSCGIAFHVLAAYYFRGVP